LSAWHLCGWLSNVSERSINFWQITETKKRKENKLKRMKKRLQQKEIAAKVSTDKAGKKKRGGGGVQWSKISTFCKHRLPSSPRLYFIYIITDYTKFKTPVYNNIQYIIVGFSLVIFGAGNKICVIIIKVSWVCLSPKHK